MKPRITVIGVRSSCDTAARKRSFRAEARWSSRAVPGDAAALLLEQLVLLGEAARLVGQALVRRGVGERHREARRDRGRACCAPGRVKGATAPRPRTPTASPKYSSGRWRLSRGQDAAVEEVRRSASARRPRRGSAAARASPAAPPRGPPLALGAAERDGRREVALAVGDVEHGARGARDLDDPLQHPRPEPREVVDGRRRGEHGVDGGLDVAGLERPAALAVEARGRVEVARRARRSRRWTMSERRGGARGPRRGPRSACDAADAGRQDPPVDVGEQRRRGRATISAASTTSAVVAASRWLFSCSSPKAWPRAKSRSRLVSWSRSVAAAGSAWLSRTASGSPGVAVPRAPRSRARRPPPDLLRRPPPGGAFPPWRPAAAGAGSRRSRSSGSCGSRSAARGRSPGPRAGSGPGSRRPPGGRPSRRRPAGAGP